MKVISETLEKENVEEVLLVSPVFSILKRGGHVYTQVIDDTKTSTFVMPPQIWTSR